MYLYTYSSSIPLVLFILLCFMLFYYLRYGAVWALVLASVNCLLTFYLKGNTGLPALVMMAATLGIAFIWPVRQNRRFLAVFSAVFILALIGLSWPLRTDLPGYIVGEMHLANAYNDAMFLPVSRNPMGAQTLSMAVTIVLAFVAVGVFSAQSFRRRQNGAGDLPVGCPTSVSSVQERLRARWTTTSGSSS